MRRPSLSAVSETRRTQWGTYLPLIGINAIVSGVSSVEEGRLKPVECELKRERTTLTRHAAEREHRKTGRSHASLPVFLHFVVLSLFI